MIDLADLPVPVIGAPMAGVSTPALVAAVTGAGGLGMLAAGYQTAAAVEAQIADVRARDVERFGLNVFVPGLPSSPDIVAAHRDRLRDRLGSQAPIGRVPTGPDPYAAVLELAIRYAVPLVSFTFGLPSAADLARLHERDVLVAATVTSLHEATSAVAVGVDALVVQSFEAGGHRGTFDPRDAGGAEPLPQLVELIAAEAGVPLIAAGGVSDGAGLRAALDAGAVAVQIGTLLLAADESGAGAVYRRAVLAGPGLQTVRTRVFTGRTARGLRNEATQTWPSPPAAYPEVHHLTAPVRAAAAAAGRSAELSLWAGTGVDLVRPGPASQIVTDLVAALQEQ